jgi:hypothetical protein
MSDTKILQLIIRVPKEHSSFVYFTLEAHDGMCFYSTLHHERGDQNRDVEINATLSFEAPLRHTLAELSKNFSLEILSESIIDD